jgi:DNA-binding MarR family transcriptional regulator
VPFVRLLAMAVAVALESLHEALARAGHTTLRPAQGFALNAISTGADTASALAGRLGMTKQGAAKLVGALMDEGYVAPGTGHDDGRRKPLILTPRGEAVVTTSVAIQEQIERRWAELVGPDRMSAVREALQAAVLAESGGVYPAVRPTW